MLTESSRPNRPDTAQTVNMYDWTDIIKLSKSQSHAWLSLGDYKPDLLNEHKSDKHIVF